MSFFTFNFFCHPGKRDDAERALQRVIERISTMPTKEEIKAAVAAAAGDEAAQVAQRIKELEDAIVAAQMTDEDKAELVAMVQNIFTPPTPPTL